MFQCIKKFVAFFDLLIRQKIAVGLLLFVLFLQILKFFIVLGNGVLQAVVLLNDCDFFFFVALDKGIETARINTGLDFRDNNNGGRPFRNLLRYRFILNV